MSLRNAYFTTSDIEHQNRMAIETVLGLLLERRSVVQNAIEKIQAVLPIVQENRPGERKGEGMSNATAMKREASK